MSKLGLLLGLPGYGGGGEEPGQAITDELGSELLAVSPQYLISAWAESNQPTVRVEKGYGSAIFQDLFPSTTGELFTAPNGAGQSATEFAGGERLFVEIPYNQALESKNTAGHPSAVTSASRRVMLDITTTTSPAFAGINAGTQDPSQHATERGYDANVSWTESLGLTVLCLDVPPASVTTEYNPVQTNGGASFQMKMQPGSNRWYPSTSVAVSQINAAARYLPSVKVHWTNSEGSTNTADLNISLLGGARHESVHSRTPSATSTPIRIFGPTLPLTGLSYAIIVCNDMITLSSVSVGSTTIPGIHKAAVSAMQANEIVVYGPVPYQLFPMDLDTETGDIQITVFGRANTAIEASHNGGAYATIGTTDANGYLSGTLSASSGSGTLSVREVGQASAAATVTNIRVGILVAVAGQSNADGRGDDVTLTATRTLYTNQIGNSTATQKSWIWVALEKLATQYSCPVGWAGYAVGSSYLYFDGASVDGRHGHWNAANPGGTTSRLLRLFLSRVLLAQTEPHFAIWHQGEQDAVDAVTSLQYKTALQAMWEKVQAVTGWTIPLHVMQIGANYPVADAKVDAIRQAQSEVVDDNPSLCSFGGALAHLPVQDETTQRVHFWTQAQKDNVADVFLRHALGAGRGPRFSSMVASGTTITITCTGGVSPLTIDAGEEAHPIGWTVSDGGGAKTVTAVSVSGLVITLTVNSSLTGTVSVKWLSHETGIGTTLLDSDATTPVPPEPFSQTVEAT